MSEVIESDIDSSDDEEELSLGQELEAALGEAREQSRDEDGRFAEEPKAPAANNEQPVLAPEKSSTEKSIKAPDSWSPQAKAKFNELPPEIQNEVSRREEEVHKGFTRFDEERVLGKQVKDVVSPYLPMIRSEGGDPVQAIGNLLQTAYLLRTQDANGKRNILLSLANQFGIDINGLQQPQQQYIDPHVQQLQQQVQQLTQERQYQSYQAEQRENAQVHSTIESFASDSANVYFSNVRPQMAILLQNGQAQNLQEAYEMACWARPDIRPLMLQSQQKQLSTNKKVQADKARKAGSSVTGSPFSLSGKSVAPKDSLSEEIAAQLESIRGRV